MNFGVRTARVFELIEHLPYGKFRLCPLIRNFTDEAELDNALFSYTFDNVLSPH